MFALWVGTTQGAYDIYTSGHIAGNVTSETATIPANGAKIWVRLNYEVLGIWEYADYSFTEARLPVLSGPTASPLSGPTQFTWNTGDPGATMFALWVGTTQGAYDIYTSGHVASNVTSETVSIPANGAKIWVRLNYELNGAWNYTDYTFTEAIAPPSLTGPASSPLSGPTKFTWNPGSVGATMFALWVGTTQGADDIYTSGHVASSVTSETVSIPANGATIYVRLWYELNGNWSYLDYNFSEAS